MGVGSDEKVHLELGEEELPRQYTLLRVRVPEDIATQQLTVPAREAWKTDHNLTRHVGNSWLISSTTALAWVPSAILPNTMNVLLNPLHPDAKAIQVLESTRAIFDPRLMKHLRA